MQVVPLRVFFAKHDGISALTNLTSEVTRKRGEDAFEGCFPQRVGGSNDVYASVNVRRGLLRLAMVGHLGSDKIVNSLKD